MLLLVFGRTNLAAVKRFRSDIRIDCGTDSEYDFFQRFAFVVGNSDNFSRIVIQIHRTFLEWFRDRDLICADPFKRKEVQAVSVSSQADQEPAIVEFLEPVRRNQKGLRRLGIELLISQS